MKVEKNIILNKLFDAYGELLSKGQQDIMSAHLQSDFTVSEIAQNLGVSRQSVMDSVNKAERKLFELEEKLSFVKKIDTLESEIEDLKLQLSKFKEE